MLLLETRARDVISHITQGRVICRLVSLFEPVESLVDENDRRRRIALTDEVDHPEYTLE